MDGNLCKNYVDTKYADVDEIADFWEKLKREISTIFSINFWELLTSLYCLDMFWYLSTSNFNK